MSNCYGLVGESGNQQDPRQENKLTAVLKYTHLPLGVEVESFAGYYTPEDEIRLEYTGRDVLYVVGYVAVEATCGAVGAEACRAVSYRYATVQGYLLEWQSETNEGGLAISTVEQISDQTTINRIKQIILDREQVSQVQFR